MASLSLLRYGFGCAGAATTNVRTTTVDSSIFSPSVETYTEEEDDGPFFDLHFVVSVQNTHVLSQQPKHYPYNSVLDGDDGQRDFRLSVSTLAESATKPQLRKPNSEPVGAERARTAPASPKRHLRNFFINFKVVEVPAFLTRDISTRAREEKVSESSTATEVLHKYLNKMYKRYGDKLRLSGLLGLVSAAMKAAAATGVSRVRDDETVAPTGVRVVVKKLGKSKSESLMPPATARVVLKKMRKSKSESLVVPAQQKLDDSQLQQEEGIRGAIAHCKRSFNDGRAVTE